MKILMAADGSAHDAETAQALGKLFQGVADLEVTVLNVANIQFPMASAADIGMVPVMHSSHEIAGWENAARAQAQEIVARAETQVQRAGLRAQAKVAWGLPADVIVQIAEQGGYDLIALGSRGAGQVAGIFLGSVSDRVAHRAKVPVLIIR